MWQLRVQISERRDRELPKGTEQQSPITPAWAGELPIDPPFGRLPAKIRGREAILDELRRMLVRRHRKPRTWVVTGMGGLGKSTVALTVAYKALARGWSVWWITAADSASLLGGMLGILRHLRAPEIIIQAVKEGTPNGPALTWEFLNSAHAARRWLLIFDNADDPAVLAAKGEITPADGTGWLRPDPSGLVIVTTRLRDRRVWGPWVSFREIQPLDQAASAQVLADLAPEIADPTGDQARDLGDRLGGLPLALHLAGSHLASPFTHWNSFSDYRHALDSSDLPTALADLDDPAVQARATIQRTWDLSLDSLASGGRPQTRPLLFLLACYAPGTPVPVSLLRPDMLLDLLYISKEAAGNTDRGQDRLLREGLNGLAAVGLIDITNAEQNNDRAVMVHNVVVDANRSRLQTSNRSQLLTVGNLAVGLIEVASTKLDYRSPTDWPDWRTLTPHLASMLIWLSIYLDQEACAILVKVSSSAVNALVRSGNFAAAGNLSNLSLAAAERFGSVHPAILSARHSAAWVDAEKGRFAYAEKQYRQIVDERSAVLGRVDRDTMRSRNNLAWVVGLQGRNAEAERMLLELLQDQHCVLERDDPDTLLARDNLGRVTAGQGRYADAEQLYRELVTDQEHALGPYHPQTLFARHALAQAIARQGRYMDAEKLYRQVLMDQQRTLGLDHPYVLTSYQGLAEVIAGQSRYSEAEKILREVLLKRRRVLGEEHPFTLLTQLELSKAITRKGHRRLGRNA